MLVVACWLSVCGWRWLSCVGSRWAVVAEWVVALWLELVVACWCSVGGGRGMGCRFSVVGGCAIFLAAVPICSNAVDNLWCRYPCYFGRVGRAVCVEPP